MSHPNWSDPHQQPHRSWTPDGQQEKYGWPAPRRRSLPWLVTGAGAVLMLSLGATAYAAFGGDSGRIDVRAVADARNPSPGPVIATTSAPADPAKPATVTAAEPIVTAKPVVAVKPAATSKPAKVVKPTATAAPQATASPFTRINQSEWQEIATNPDDHIGRKIVLYGAVVRSAVVGPSRIFVALAGPSDMADPTMAATVFEGPARRLAGFGPSDAFRAEVIVVGSQGTDRADDPTAPKMKVVSIRHL